MENVISMEDVVAEEVNGVTYYRLADGCSSGNIDIFIEPTQSMLNFHKETKRIAQLFLELKYFADKLQKTISEEIRCRMCKKKRKLTYKTRKR